MPYGYETSTATLMRNGDPVPAIGVPLTEPDVKGERNWFFAAATAFRACELELAGPILHKCEFTTRKKNPPGYEKYQTIEIIESVDTSAFALAWARSHALGLSAHWTMPASVTAHLTDGTGDRATARADAYREWRRINCLLYERDGNGHIPPPHSMIGTVKWNAVEAARAAAWALEDPDVVRTNPISQVMAVMYSETRITDGNVDTYGEEGVASPSATFASLRDDFMTNFDSGFLTLPS